MLVSRADPAQASCAEWCAAARQCLGDAVYEQWLRSRGAGQTEGHAS